MTSTAARKNDSSDCLRCRLSLVLVHLERKLGVHVAAVVAGGVGELGGAALGAADGMDRPQRVVRQALALAGLAVFLNGEHVEIHSCAEAAGNEGPGRCFKCLSARAMR